MNLIYKIILTLNTTFWMIIIYIIKESWTVRQIPRWLFWLALMFIPIILSLLSIFIAKKLGEDTLQKCEEYSLADNEFLPNYLGFFFLSVSISECRTFIVVYLLVFIFTYLSQTQYFNPIYLLFGYHYYHILTSQGTRVLVIAKGKVIRNKENISFDHLRRINDTTYIERG